MTNRRLSTVVERAIATRLRLPVAAFGMFLGVLLAGVQCHTVAQSNQELAVALSRHVQQHVDAARTLLQILAAMGAHASAEDTLRAMGALQQHSHYFEQIIRLDAGGDVMAALPPAPAVVRHDMEATQDGDRLLSPPRRSPDTGALVVEVECGIPGGGAMVGLLNLETITATLYDLLGHGQDGQLGQDVLILADEQGGVFLQPEHLAARGIANIADWPAFRQAVDEVDSIMLQRVDGRLCLAVTRQLPKTGWVLMVLRPLAALLQPALVALAAYLASVALLYVMLAAAVRQEMRVRVSRPMQEFARAIRARGRWERDEPVAATADLARLVQDEDVFEELAELANAFVRMDDLGRLREHARRESEARLRALYENAIEGIFQISPEGKILHGNPALAQMFGYQDEDDIRRHVTTMVQVYARPEMRSQILAALAAHGVIRGFELPMLRKDGGVIWVAVNAVAVHDDHGQLCRIEGMLADITQRKHSEEALARSQEFFRAVFEGIHDAVIVHAVDTSVVVDVNSRACEMFGYSHAEMLQLDIAAISDDTGPYRLQDALDNIQIAKARGVHAFEWRSKRKCGDVFWTDVCLSFARFDDRECCIATVRDITERKEHELARQQAEQRYSQLVQNAPVGIFRSTLDGQLILANPEIAGILGDDSPESLLDRMQDIRQSLYANPEDRTAILEQLLKAEAVQGVELRFKRRDGSPFWCSLTARLVRDDQGRPAYIEGFQMDITDRKLAEAAREQTREQLEQQVASRTKELRQANARLLELDRLKTSFLSSASHELRTPLTSILGFAKLTGKLFRRHYFASDEASARERVYGERIAGNLDIIAKEGARLSRLVNDLLDINAIESGMMAWRDAKVDLREVLDEAAASARGMLPASGRVRLELAVESDLPTMMMDRDKILQVLQNLLGNAVKFTTAGHIRLAASTLDQAVECEGGRLEPVRMVEIRVEDTGPGIPAAALETVFEKFYQIVPLGSDEDKPRGTGLGLAICREIVEHYGGRIWVESTLGLGSTFILRVPVLRGTFCSLDAPNATTPGGVA